MLKYCIAIWNISLPFGISYDHLIHFFFIWNIFPVLVSSSKKDLTTLGWATFWATFPLNSSGHPDRRLTFKHPAFTVGLPDVLFSNQKSQFG
jgi:hypothetical protein